MNLTDTIVAQQIDEVLAAADAHDGIAPIVGAGDPILRAPVLPYSEIGRAHV